MKVNLSEPVLYRKKVQWKHTYKQRKYIAFQDTRFAVGEEFKENATMGSASPLKIPD